MLATRLKADAKGWLSSPQTEEYYLGRWTAVPQGFLLLWMVLNKVLMMMPFAKKKNGGCEFQHNEKAIMLTYLICCRACTFIGRSILCTFIGRLILCTPSSSAPVRLRHCTKEVKYIVFYNAKNSRRELFLVYLLLCLQYSFLVCRIRW